MSDFGFYLVQALTGLSSASALFLVASGLSIIFGVTRVVNFAHGSFYMVGAYIAYTFVEHPRRRGRLLGGRAPRGGGRRRSSGWSSSC